jgi:peptide-methionine (S)-S-oxide reductase
MIDVLIDAGAMPGENAHNALVNGHLEAAEHLVKRGGELTLATVLCLGRFEELPRLAAPATSEQRQFAFVLVALNGKPDGVAWMLRDGIAINNPSADLYPHGTPLHHAVCSGSLETVKVLVEGGADLRRTDSAWKGTPLGWAQHYVDSAVPEMRDRYVAIASDLSNQEGKTAG